VVGVSHLRGNAWYEVVQLGEIALGEASGGLRSEEGVPIPEDQVHAPSQGSHPQAEPAGHPSRCREPRLDGLACIPPNEGVGSSCPRLDNCAVSMSRLPVS